MSRPVSPTHGLGTLPEHLTVNGHSYPIQTDYRACLAVLQAVNDPALTAAEKAGRCLMLYDDFGGAMPRSDYPAAYEAICGFLDHGAPERKTPPQRLMDWEQDEDILFPAVNRAAGFEVRGVAYMHWWTFLGLLMSVDGESVWARVLALRAKRARGEKLEKWEAAFWNANRDLCQLRPRETPEERQQKAEVRALFGYGKWSYNNRC